MTETTVRDVMLDAYESIARDPRYAHFINIPERIIRCLDHFAIEYNCVEVRRRLLAYYLFIGVVDDAIDSGNVDAGREILRRFHGRLPVYSDRALRAGLLTQVLKDCICEEIYPAMLSGLDDLYQAVVNERKAETISAFIEQRKVVGRLTARLSYLLVNPFLESEERDFCRFMEEVGAVGCLVDSLIDLRADAKLGLIFFRPTIGDFLILLTNTLVEGLRVAMRHPALVRLFLEAIADNARDRFRTGSRSAPRLVAAPEKEGVPSVV
jgi:hypothetical protein